MFHIALMVSGEHIEQPLFGIQLLDRVFSLDHAIGVTE
jgi:hypothetical protein